MSHNDDAERVDLPPTVERTHDDGATIVITGDLLAELFGGVA